MTDTPLNRELIIKTAVALADEAGLEKLSMRRLAGMLGIQAMSLYHHIANKERLLDAMVDCVYAEIGLMDAGLPWRDAMRARALTAREVMGRHPWSAAVMNSREQPGPATLAHHNSVLAHLRRDGFSVRLAAHAFSVLDAYIFGFVLTEGTLPFQTAEEAAALGKAIQAQMGDAYPAMTEMLVDHVLQPGYTYATEFTNGLELILSGLELQLSAAERNG